MAVDAFRRCSTGSPHELNWPTIAGTYSGAEPEKNPPVLMSQQADTSREEEDEATPIRVRTPIMVECPYGCGEPIVRYLIDSHKTSCGYQLVDCWSPGCTGKYKKKDENEHFNNFNAQHMKLLSSMTDTVYKELKEELQQVEKELKRVQDELAEEGKKSLLQQLKIEGLTKKSETQQQKINELTEMIMALKEKLARFERKRSSQPIGLDESFCMHRFSETKANAVPWRSPEMATEEGCKFLFEIYVDESSALQGLAFTMKLYSVKGERDEQLPWPVKGYFTLTLINFKGGDDKKVSEYISWERPEQDCELVSHFPVNALPDLSHSFIKLSKLPFFLNQDRLHFKLFVITDDS